MTSSALTNSSTAMELGNYIVSKCKATSLLFPFPILHIDEALTDIAFHEANG